MATNWTTRVDEAVAAYVAHVEESRRHRWAAADKLAGAALAEAALRRVVFSADCAEPFEGHLRHAVLACKAARVGFPIGE